MVAGHSRITSSTVEPKAICGVRWAILPSVGKRQAGSLRQRNKSALRKNPAGLLQRKERLAAPLHIAFIETDETKVDVMMTRRSALTAATAIAAAMALANPANASTVVAASPGPALKLPRQKVQLVTPPFAHAHEQVSRHGPRIMEFTIVIEEKQIVIDDQGTKFQAMTFNGSMPGPLMIVHEGDYVELTLVNPDTNTMPHNIDFHSATGALGGAALTLVNPGEQVVLRWKADRPGTFVYHCAPEGPMTPPVLRDGLRPRRPQRRLRGRRPPGQLGLQACERGSHVTYGVKI